MGKKYGRTQPPRPPAGPPATAEEGALRVRALLARGPYERNYWPGLLRLRSGIFGVGFHRKARCRAGFEVCRSELAPCRYRAKILH